MRICLSTFLFVHTSMLRWPRDLPDSVIHGAWTNQIIKVAWASLIHFLQEIITFCLQQSARCMNANACAFIIRSQQERNTKGSSAVHVTTNSVTLVTNGSMNALSIHSDSFI